MEISNSLSRITGSATAQILAKAKDMEAQGRDIIHLEIGQPSFQPPEIIIEATKSALDRGDTSYTVSQGKLVLREAVASYHKHNGKELDYSKEVIITSGAKIGIFGVIWSVLNPGDNVIVLNPSWVSYGDMVTALGGEARYLAVDLNFDFEEDKLLNMIDAKTKAFIVNSPCNPTGSIISFSNLKKLYNICSSNNILLISDEIYSEYVFEGSHTSLLSIPNWKDFGVVINGFSKTFSMTGFRLGYVLSNQTIIKQVNKVMQLTSTCAVNFAQSGALIALKHIDKMREYIDTEIRSKRDLTTSLLQELPIEYQPPQGAIYAWFKLPTEDSINWTENLLESTGVALTPGRAFGPDGEGYARMCFASSENSIREGILRINQFLNS